MECGPHLGQNKYGQWPGFGPVLVYLSCYWLICGHTVAYLRPRSGKQEWTPPNCHRSVRYVVLHGSVAFCYYGPKLWNRLYMNIQIATSVNPNFIFIIIPSFVVFNVLT